MNTSIARAVAGLLGCISGLLWLLCMYVVGRSGFSTDPAMDPHGFGLMFGTVVGVIAGLIFASVTPAAFPAAGRKRASRVCLLIYAGLTGLLYAALYLF